MGEVVVNRAALFVELRRLYRVAAKGREARDLPILSRLLISAKDGRLTLAAASTRGTGLSYQTVIPVADPEAVLDPCAPSARSLLSAVETLAGEQVWLEARTERDRPVLGVSGDDAVFGLELPERYSAGAYPNLPGETGGASRELAGGVLSRLVRGVESALSREESRLGAMALNLEPATAGAVATDGHRLSWYTEAIPEGPEVATLVDRHAVHCLRWFDCGGPVTVANGSGVSFARGAARLVTGNTTEKFPDYQKVVNGFDPTKSIAVDRVRLLAAARRCATVGKRWQRAARFRVEVDRLMIEKMADRDGGDSVRCVVPAAGTEAARLSFRMNPQLLADTLAAMRGPTVAIDYRDENTMFRFRAIGLSETETHTAVVMPMLDD